MNIRSTFIQPKRRVIISVEIYFTLIYLLCSTLIATMLLLQFTMISGLLFTSTASSLAVGTTIAQLAPTPKPSPRDATASQQASTTSAIEFITTKYITIAGQTNDHVTIAPQTITLALPTCSQTITPDKNGYVPPGTCGALYDYYPSFAAAVVFAILFGMLTVAHIAQAAVFKKVSSALSVR